MSSWLATRGQLSRMATSAYGRPFALRWIPPYGISASTRRIGQESDGAAPLGAATTLAAYRFPQRGAKSRSSCFWSTEATASSCGSGTPAEVRSTRATSGRDGRLAAPGRGVAGRYVTIGTRASQRPDHGPLKRPAHPAGSPLPWVRAWSALVVARTLVSSGGLAASGERTVRKYMYGPSAKTAEACAGGCAYVSV